MKKSATDIKLSSMTDDGLFEKLATAVLRETNSDYALLTHPGVNDAGKVVKAPVDGLLFIPRAKPPHMVMVHHTTCSRDDLEKKWLHDPKTVKRRKGKKATAPAGDVLKSIAVFKKEKKARPSSAELSSLQPTKNRLSHWFVRYINRLTNWD